MASDHGAVAGREPDRDRDRERQLFAILADYFEAVEAGQAPDRAEWLARYPDWAEEIARFLDDQDRLLKLTEPLRPIAEAAARDESVSDRTLGLGEMTAGLISDPRPAMEPRNGSTGHPAGTKVRYIGDYELIAEIARGGMGVVFRARQRSLNRPVALKMLRAEILMTEAEEQRFRQEAEAAANLDHPNIVPIFEVGRHDGHSYFSMKLVEGGSLAQRLPDFASDHRAAARLMAIVARAVHHAHQRGVLHRDLKPSNILLSGGPDIPIEQIEPHVTDFGLAKRVGGDPELTQSGAILGTPSYMAPEQAIGKKGLITVATDVYGLGAVLYTILSGRPPFQGDSALETIAQVKDRALDPPSRHGRRVDRDLETICLKCLEKEPARRYGSAEAVAEDLERWLTGEPILARPVGRCERAWRWCRRNPAVAALTSAVVLLLMVTLAGLLISNRMMARERDEARRQRRQAETNFRRAREAVDQMLTEVSEQALGEIPQAQPVRRALLEKAAAFYREFLGEQASDPLLRDESARAYSRLGGVESDLGHFPEAAGAYQRQIELLQESLRGDPQNAEHLRDLVWAHFRLAADQRAVGDLAGAVAESRRAAEIAQAVAQRFPGNRADRETLARAADQQAVWLWQMDKITEAASFFRRAVEIEEQLGRDDPADSRHTILAGTLNNLAILTASQGKHAEAAALLERAITHQKEALKADPKNRTQRRYLRNQYENLAMTLVELGKPREALEAAGAIIPLGQSLMTDYPKQPEYRHDLAESYHNLGMIQQVAGRDQEAEASFRRAIELDQKLVEDSPKVPSYQNVLAESFLELGNLLKNSSRPGAARDAYRRAWEGYERMAAQFPQVPDSRSRPAVAANRFAWFLVTCSDPRLRDPVQAVELAGRATKLQPKNAGYWNTLGVAHYRAGEWKAAIEALEKSRQLRPGGDAADWFFLAMAHWQQGDRHEARRWYDRAVAWMEKNRSHDDDLRRFRVEADELLGLADDRMPNGIDAFRPE